MCLLLCVQILPPTLAVANTRPLPVPVELFQLSSLGDVLNLDTWQQELDETDREALRALLPNKVGRRQGPHGTAVHGMSRQCTKLLSLC